MKPIKLRPPQFVLHDVAKPVLYRELFPYYRVPRIIYDHKIVPMNLPEDICITDTTFRDGQQARPPYTVKQIVDIYDMLHRLGGARGVIRQSEFFLYSSKDNRKIGDGFIFLIIAIH